MRKDEAGCGEESWGEGTPGGSCGGAEVVTKCLPVFDLIVHLLAMHYLQCCISSTGALLTLKAKAKGKLWRAPRIAKSRFKIHISFKLRNEELRLRAVGGWVDG